LKLILTFPKTETTDVSTLSFKGQRVRKTAA